MGGSEGLSIRVHPRARQFYPRKRELDRWRANGLRGKRRAVHVRCSGHHFLCGGLLMPTGMELLVRRKYAEALTRLQIEASKDKTDYYKIGPVCGLAVAHLCAGHYAKGRRLLDELIATAPNRVSLHYVYAGIAQWLRNDFKEAVAYWREGMRSHYSMYRLMEIPAILWYAQSRQPSVCSMSEIHQCVEKAQKLADPESFEYALGRLILGEPCEDELHRIAATFPKQLAAAMHAETDFYTGIAKLSGHDEAAFFKNMRRCHGVQGHAQIFHEWLLARYELKRPKGKVVERTDTDKTGCRTTQVESPQSTAHDPAIPPEPRAGPRLPANANCRPPSRGAAAPVFGPHWPAAGTPWRRADVPGLALVVAGGGRFTYLLAGGQRHIAKRTPSSSLAGEPAASTALKRSNRPIFSASRCVPSSSRPARNAARSMTNRRRARSAARGRRRWGLWFWPAAASPRARTSPRPSRERWSYPGVWSSRSAATR